MNISPTCNACGSPKIAERPNGQQELAFAFTYTGQPLSRVFCGGCGLAYAPESLGCHYWPAQVNGAQGEKV